jgi:predicted ATP-dependent Lon-type protease
MYADYFHISPGASAKGSFARFRAGEVRFREEYDTELVKVAERLAKEDEGVRLAFEGMAKVLYPTGVMTEDEGRELLEFVLEMRQQALLPRL